VVAGEIGYAQVKTEQVFLRAIVTITIRQILRVAEKHHRAEKSSTVVF
jgi:hypothetical protein